MRKLYFSYGNRKIEGIADLLGIPKKAVYCFDLPAGHTCPAADSCLSFANEITGKLTDGENCKFRCFAASNEAIFSDARRVRWDNFRMLRHLSCDKMVSLILESLPKGIKVLRIHSAGDYFTRRYFLAWVKVAQVRPDIIFFGYTKVLNYVQYAKPDNFYLVYSMGGKMDSKHTNEQYAKVVYSDKEAQDLGLPLACQVHHSDDYSHILSGQSFALLIHGTQPKGSKYGRNNRNLKLVPQS